MAERTWLIYKITGECGRGYIGITTVKMPRRWASHRSAAKSGAKSPLYDAIREHAPAYFTIEILTECYSSREAISCERAMIALHDTYYTKNGWNRNIGGGGNVYGAMSDAFRSKLSEAQKRISKEKPENVWKRVNAYNAMGRPVSPEGRERKLAGLRCAHTPEVRERIAAKARGKKQDPERAAESRANALKGKKIYLRQLWCQSEYEKALAARI